MLAATAALPAQELEQPDGARVVRAYFDDPLVAARAVMSLDALESEYEKGYIILRGTEEDIETARQAGMRIVEDDDYVSVTLPSEPPTDVVEGTIAGFPCYRTVEETYASAREIARAHPNLATWKWAGRSWKKRQGSSDGYTLYVLRLTNSETTGPKPVLFITAALHAREYTTAELALRFAEHLVASYETDADVRWLLDHQEVHIMLQANPDGRKRAEEGLLWRKNHNTRHCRSSWAGVDLNRNFDFKWGESGTSTNECSMVYRGLSAASEPETQAIQTYMARLFPDARGPGDGDAASSGTSGVVLDIHSHGRLIIWPWGHVHDPAPNGRALQTFGRKLAYFNGYRPLQAVGLYPASGTTEDYGYGVLGRASFTYELGTTFFQDCGRFENSILNDNLESLLYAFKVARTPYRTPAGPDVRDLSLSGDASTTGVAAGTAVILSATFDDTRYENGNGFEPTQNIAAGEYYVDAPPWAWRRTANTMHASDQAFDSRTESATASIDTTDLAAGRHTVFVRARDTDGNWGAVSAIFLQVAAAEPPPTDDDPPPTDDDPPPTDDDPPPTDDDTPPTDDDTPPTDDDTPPTAAFEVHGAVCGVDLCRVHTGNPVRFTDTSSGPVELRRWNFGDGTESSSPAPEHAWTEPGFFKVTLRVSGGQRESSVSRTFLVAAAEPQGTCVPTAETLCLQDSRYAVAAQWRKADGETGMATVVHAGTNDSGLLRFFSPDNWEILIKVLDGCSLNGHFWVYAASTTDIGYIIRVTDSATGLEKEYRNEPGMPASAITDATAFPDGCRPP